jgi:molybdopterin/thiamine biosynthesis adenylyltransferase
MVSTDKHGVNAWAARVLDPNEPGDRALLQQLRSDPQIQSLDESAGQAENLRSLRPRRDPALLAEPGRWAYYPWRRAMVAVLGPRGFRSVRLDRNRNLITAEEQAQLGELRIGVAGLSVGHVIAHTLAAQGLCGLLRLADFDSLELTNLNRVPATVFDLGLNKAVVVARRIAELDPYLPVQVLEAGLTVDTVDEFLDGLDIVVEECDSLHMKALVRERARARRIPVLMATSDRGIVDIERFDIEPDRPILHGLLGELDLALLPGMSSRDKVPHMLRHLDAERLSARMAASLVEVDRSLSTWPQLAGEVGLGATALAEAVRRIGLGESLRSGQIRIDVGSALDRLHEPEMVMDRPPPADYTEPALPGVSGAVAAAALRAPSGGNVQPWHICVRPDAVTVRIAPEHSSTMDVAFRGSAVALGAAVFNAKVAAAAHHVLGPLTLVEDGVDTPLQATLSLCAGDNGELAALYRAMLARETNRRRGTPSTLPEGAVELLHSVADREGARLRLLTGRSELDSAAAILAATDRIRYLTPRLHQEMISEVRWPGDASPDTGIDVRSLELDAGGLAVLDILRRPDVMRHLAQWNAGSALVDETRDHVLASSALAVVSVAGHTLSDYVRGGSAVEALWITAQQCGLAVQPVSPVFLYARDAADIATLTTSFTGEMERLQQDFLELSGVSTGESVVLVLRFASVGPASVRSRRSSDRVRLLSGCEGLP